MNLNLLGDRLRTERLKLKLSQEQLAELSGISSTFMGHIERAERTPSLETVIKLANALGVTVDSLLQDSIKATSDTFINHFSHLVNGLDNSQKQMILDVVQAMIPHFEKEDT
ncbi:helix-turn-helix transcriptional regulator [Paenibacillus oryzisoli]|uniref:helix-turn-helix domain-containing protein n=1 Tax=Paenibacillus oryzisoli TaxID=1850517 RepID=UPI003D2967DE